MTIDAITAYCRAHLDLAQAVLTDNAYYYYSLPLCVIDAVFSIGVRYSSTEATVLRFCESFKLPLSRGVEIPPREEQLSIQKFVEINLEYGTERMAADIYRNRQRTSTRGGILKAEAAALFAQVLANHGVNHFQDLNKVQGNSEFEAAIKEISGQHSGISMRYFYMLAGDEKDLPILMTASKLSQNRYLRPLLVQRASKTRPDGQAIFIRGDRRAAFRRRVPACPG